MKEKNNLSKLFDNLEKISLLRLAICAAFLFFIQLFSFRAYAATVYNETESNDSVTEANVVEVNTSIFGSINKSSDKDFYKFSLKSDGYIYLTLGHEFVDKSSVWNMYLLNSTGTSGEMNRWTAITGQSTEAYKTGLIGLPAGDYYIYVTGNWGNDSNWDTTQYELNINYIGIDSWEREENDERSSANVINVNSRIYGSIMKSDDKDYYHFSLPEDGTVYLTFDHDYVDKNSVWNVYLLDTVSSELNSWTAITGKSTDGYTTTRYGLSKGDYYIYVKGNWGNDSNWDITPYSLTAHFVPTTAWESGTSLWEGESDDSFEVASLIENKVPVGGSLSSETDADYYKLNLEDDGYAKLTFQHQMDTDFTNAAWRVKLYDGSQVLLTEWVFDKNTDAPQTAENIIGLSKGTYYAMVQAYSDGRWSSVPYGLRIDHVASQYWETEVNDNFAGADALVLNETKHGSLMRSDDYDYYKFTTTSDGFVDITIDKPSVDSEFALAGWDVFLYDAGQNQIFKLEAMVTDEAVIRSEQTELAAGTYYLKVIPHGDVKEAWSVDTYSLLAGYISKAAWENGSRHWEIENNENFDSATEMATNEMIGGGLATSVDKDFYTTTIEKSGTIALTFVHDKVAAGTKNWTVTFYDNDKEIIRDYTFGEKDNKEVTTAKMGMPAGKYYIMVMTDGTDSFSSSTYSIRVDYEEQSSWEIEKNDSPDMANALTVGEIRNGSLHLSSDKDYYTIPVPEQAVYRIAFSHPTDSDNIFSWKVTVFNEAGEKLVSDVFRGTVTSDYGTTFSLPVGNAVVVVDSCNKEGGEYTGSYWNDGSYAVKLLRFADIKEHTDHKMEYHSEVEPTCTENGSISYYSCSICGRFFSDENGENELQEDELVWQAYGHDIENVDWKYNEDEHWKECSRCGEKVELSSHSFQWIIDSDATYEEEGYRHQECTVCGFKKDEGTVISRIERERSADTEPTEAESDKTKYNTKPAEESQSSGKSEVKMPISINNASVSLSAESFTYNGNAQYPTIKSVRLNGSILKEGTDYQITYPIDTVNAGDKVIVIKGAGNYTGSINAEYKIDKVTVEIKPSAVKLSKKKVNRKKQIIKIKVSNSRGKISYKNTTSKRLKKNISISKAGKITIKKKAPKGTYSIRVTVAENGNYAETVKTIKIKVK